MLCSVSDHETAASANTMNTTPILAGNLSDFLEKTDLMTHFLPKVSSIWFAHDGTRILTTVPLPGSAMSAGLTDPHRRHRKR